MKYNKNPKRSNKLKEASEKLKSIDKAKQAEEKSNLTNINKLIDEGIGAVAVDPYISNILSGPIGSPGPKNEDIEFKVFSYQDVIINRKMNKYRRVWEYCIYIEPIDKMQQLNNIIAYFELPFGSTNHISEIKRYVREYYQNKLDRIDEDFQMKEMTFEEHPASKQDTFEVSLDELQKLNLNFKSKGFEFIDSSSGNILYGAKE